MSRLETHTLLLALGFNEDPTIMSDGPAGLRIDFGNLELTAAHVLGRSFQPVVRCGGVLRQRNSLVDVQFELPREFKDLLNGLAILTYYLDSHAGGKFIPLTPAVWLDLGREHFDLLPWQKERSAYDKRPVCAVRRDFARPAIKYLGELLANTPPGSSVSVEFDGEVLKLRTQNGVAAMPADGTAWPATYLIKVRDLQPLPKRFMKETVRFSVWEGNLHIDNRRYRRTIAYA